MASAKADHALERIVFFSDAVFAIAITLLVLINLRVNRIATCPPMLADDASPEEAAAVPRRSRSVALAAATAMAVSFFLPYAAPVAMATVPIWRWLLDRRARSRPVAGDRAEA